MNKSWSVVVGVVLAAGCSSGAISNEDPASSGDGGGQPSGTGVGTSSVGGSGGTGVTSVGAGGATSVATTGAGGATSGATTGAGGATSAATAGAGGATSAGSTSSSGSTGSGAGGSTGAWPHEPEGFATLYDCAFDGDECGADDVYDSVEYMNVDDAPMSAPSVGMGRLPAGATEGGAQVVVYLDDVKELFFGTWWATNSDFEGMCNNGNKMFFFRRPEIDNSFLMWYGAAGTDVPKNIGWGNQTAYSNAMVPGWSGDASGLSGGWGGSVDVLPGSGWHRLEVYLKTSTTTDSQDGVIRWWVDGNLAGDVVNVNQSPGGFQEFQSNNTWDGSYCLMNRDLSKEWIHYWDHWHISVPQ